MSQLHGSYHHNPAQFFPPSPELIMNRKEVLDRNRVDYTNDSDFFLKGLIHMYCIFNKTVNKREIKSGVGKTMTAV